MIMTNINDTAAFLYNTIVEAPGYHLFLEGILVIWVFWLLRRKKKPFEDKITLTPEEEEQIFRAWKPKPLVSLVAVGEENNEGQESQERQTSNIWGPIQGRPGKYIEIEGEMYLNLATHNYLGLVDDPELDKEAERCIRKYGVGSCGPRGFYGTVDVHLELEEKIAKFLGMEETALYSYGFSTIASAIPSYSKAGDLIFADEQVNFSIQKGLQASRSIVYYFKHNDATDLGRLLTQQAALDAKNPKKAKTIRRFCVVEGIYSKTGEMCNLKPISKLCKHNKVRLFVDESISFGTIGATGRGVTEYLNVPVKDIDLISGSLEHGLAAFGGFIVGPSFVVDHQRISGLGYCFSASLPPLLAGVGIKSLEMIEENPKMVAKLQKNCRFMDKNLKNKLHQYLHVSGHPLSPVKHLFVKNGLKMSKKEKETFFRKVIILAKNITFHAFVQPTYLDKEEARQPEPSIRITVSRNLTQFDISRAVDALTNCVERIIRDPVSRVQSGDKDHLHISKFMAVNKEPLYASDLSTESDESLEIMDSDSD